MNSGAEEGARGVIRFMIQAVHDAWRLLPGGGLDSSPPARIALALFLLTTATVAFLAVAIVALHTRNDRAKRREKQWSDRWFLHLIDPDNHGPLAPLRPHQLLAFGALWTHIHDSMRGEIRSTLVEISRSAGTIPLCMDALRGGGRRERILAAGLLGNHLEEQAIPLLEPLVEDTDPFLSLACARALLRIAPVPQTPRLLPSLLRRGDWPLPVVHDLLSDLDPDLLSAHLPSTLLGWQPAPPPRAIRMLRLAREDVRVSLVETLLRRSSPIPQESEAALLREVIDPDQIHFVRRGLDSPHWPVVVAALNTMVRLGAREDLPRLTELVGHKEWWVRYRAARAIVLLPGMKAIEVELLAARHPDRFAKEMLRFALAERNLQ